MLTLADILESLTGIRPSPAAQINVLRQAQDAAAQVITEATVDSRQVIPGALFVALPGERVDGHDFVAQAFKKGAVLALIEHDLNPQSPAAQFPVIDLRLAAISDPSADDGMVKSDLLAALAGIEGPFCLRVEKCLPALQQIASFWRRKLKVKVIGVTGSVGKSTTKELVAEVLSQRYRTLKSPGNLNNEIGLPLTVLSLSEGHQRAVLEMGFYVPGEIAFLCDIAQPAIGIVTNVGTVHAERAGSVEAIAQGKAELVQALPSDGWAILNYDDPWVRGMAAKTSARAFFYGLDSRADLWADEVNGLGLDGISFKLHFRREVLHLRVPLIGRHSVHTALRAAAVGLVDGLTWQEIIEGLRSSATQLRLVAVRTSAGALLLDDTYNASPESTLAALNLLAELDGRKMAVLGDMLELGLYEEQGHELVGVRAAEIVAELVTVGQRAHGIANAARASNAHSSRPPLIVKEFDASQQAIEYLQGRLTEKDVVLVKGSRGMRMDRIVAALESAASAESSVEAI